jgi:hypothetical protein
MANLIALFYNWWSLYLRFYDEGQYREAIRAITERWKVTQRWSLLLPRVLLDVWVENGFQIYQKTASQLLSG